MKRLIAILAALMLLHSACAESYPVYVSQEDEGYSLLLDASGTVYTPAFEYAGIYSMDGVDGSEELFCAYKADTDATENDCVLMNGRGEVLGNGAYASLEYRSGVVLATDCEGWTSAMDTKGNLLLADAYAWIVPNGEGGYLAMKLDKTEDPYEVQDGAVIVIHADGTETQTGVTSDYWQHGWYASGLCRVVDSSNGGKTEYLDADGKIVFAISGYACDFTDGLLIVSDEQNKMHLLNVQGEEILDGSYADISYDSDLGDAAKIIAVSDSGAIQILNPITFECECAISSCGAAVWAVMQEQEGLLSVWYEDRTRIYDLQGKLLFESMDYSTDNIQLAYCYHSDGSVIRFTRREGDWPGQTQTLMDASGANITAGHRYVDGLYCQDGQGRYLITDYDVVENADGSVEALEESMRYGICDENGKTILQTEYNSIEMLSWNLYWVNKGNQWGLLDEGGNWQCIVETQDN